MRDILFRGKSEDGRWVYGSLIKTGKFCCILQDDDGTDYSYPYLNELTGCIDGDATLVDPETVGQWTGLVDRNGKKIFEYDVCRFREWKDREMCWVGAVCYEHQQFVISGSPNKECETNFTLQLSRFIPRNIEVVGNIHDNPEWVKGETNETT